MQHLATSSGKPKAHIIEVLSSEFPLTAKKVYNTMKKRYQTSSTYHAVYMHIQELVGQGVAVKDGTEYRLSERWVSNTLEIAQRTEIRYSKTYSDSVLGIANDVQNVKLLVFDSMKQFHSFIVEYKRQFVENAAEGSKVYWLTNHIWWTLLYMCDYADITARANGKKIQYHLAIRGSDPLDEAVRSFYKNMGIKDVKTGVANNDRSIIGIYNDTMMMVIYPDDLLASIDDFFSETDKVDNMDVMRFFDKMLNRKSRIFMIMVKNKYFVDSQKKQIMSLF